MTPLFYAARAGKWESADDDDVDNEDSGGAEAAVTAGRSTGEGHSECIRLLAAAGASADAPNRARCVPSSPSQNLKFPPLPFLTPLYLYGGTSHAFYLFHSLSPVCRFVHLIINLARALRQAVQRNITPLAFAAQCNAPEATADALLACGADPGRADPGGRTAAHVAARTGAPAVLRALLRARPGLARGADVKGATPLHMACMRGAGIPPGGSVGGGDEAFLECARLLLEAGADHSALMKTPPLAPLHLAATNSFTRAVRLLLAAGAPAGALGTVESDRATALHMSANKGAWECAVALMEAGADVAARTEARSMHLVPCRAQQPCSCGVGSVQTPLISLTRSLCSHRKRDTRPSKRQPSLTRRTRR